VFLKRLVLHVNVNYGKPAQYPVSAHCQETTLPSSKYLINHLFEKIMQICKQHASHKSAKERERERNIQSAINHYKNSNEASIQPSAEQFGVAYSTLRGHLTRVQDRVGGHCGLQALAKYEEKSILR